MLDAELDHLPCWPDRTWLCPWPMPRWTQLRWPDRTWLWPCPTDALPPDYFRYPASTGNCYFHPEIDHVKCLTNVSINIKSDCDYPIMKPWFTDKTSRSQSYRNRLISLNYIKTYQFINSRSDVYISEHVLFISFRTYPWFVLFFHTWEKLYIQDRFFFHILWLFDVYLLAKP